MLVMSVSQCFLSACACTGAWYRHTHIHHLHLLCSPSLLSPSVRGSGGTTLAFISQHTHTHIFEMIIFHNLSTHAFDSCQVCLLFWTGFTPHRSGLLHVASVCSLYRHVALVWQSLFGQWYFQPYVCIQQLLLSHTALSATCKARPVSHGSIDLRKPPIFYWANPLCISFISLSSSLWNPSTSAHLMCLNSAV